MTRLGYKSIIAHKVEVVPVVLEPHGNADSLSVVKVFDGYTCCVRTQDWIGIDKAAYIPPDSIVPNDIISDRDHNLFVITGPNNGGKTTYIRQVGQMYWLSHVGMAVPAKSAELSLVDGIYTSFNTEDNTNDGTGLYLTELKRISEFTKSNGKARITPYSVVFFDEFANGTDHDESVARTQVVLDHLSQKGVTSYFTTHKHEIADYVEQGKLPGSVNLASEVKMNGNGFVTTHRVLRNAREKSYGNFQAEAMAITPEALRSSLESEITSGYYPIEDTRVGGKK